MDTILFIFTLQGQCCLQHRLSKKITTLGGTEDDFDACVPQLQSHTLYVSKEPNMGNNSFQCLVQEIGKTPVAYPLTKGRPLQVGGLQLLVLDVESRKQSTTTLSSAATESLGLTSAVLNWLRLPMGSSLELRAALAQFLSLAIQHSGAIYGMLLLAQSNADDDEFSLVSHIGCDAAKAESIWQKMPLQISENIMRSQARIVLPDVFKDNGHADTTIFVRGIRSVAGFPVIAEGRVLALFYLGFTNLVTELSEHIQSQLESAASLLGVVIQRALLREEFSERVLSRPLSEANRLMIGNSDNIQQVYRLIQKFADFTLPLLVRGESGTGKELVAREIHRLSNRATKKFVAINAAALPESLIEGELFGYKKGAFTGALGERIGLIEQAHGGTLFIDEIGELPLALQAKILRVIQEKKITRLGESNERDVDFRLVTATHRDLKNMISKKEFREDLYFRLMGAEIELAPLRARRDDILPLAKYFASRFARMHGLGEKELSHAAVVAIESFDWPGNVRQLENVINRAFVMADGLAIRQSDLNIGQENDALDDVAVDQKGGGMAEARDVWLRQYIIDALKRNNGNRAETAKQLAIGQRTLFRYIEQLGLRDFV